VAFLRIREELLSSVSWPWFEVCQDAKICSRMKIESSKHDVLRDLQNGSNWHVHTVQAFKHDLRQIAQQVVKKSRMAELNFSSKNFPILPFCEFHDLLGTTNIDLL
jgi:hypothetical protein